MCIVVVEVVEVTLHKLLSLGGALADKLRTYEVEGTSGYKKVGSSSFHPTRERIAIAGITEAPVTIYSAGDDLHRCIQSPSTAQHAITAQYPPLSR